MASSYALAVAAAAAAAGGGAVAEEAGEAAEEALTRGMVGQTGVVVRMIAGTGLPVTTRLECPLEHA